MSDASPDAAAASQPPPSPSRARKPETPGGGLRGALVGAALGGALAAVGWAVVQAADADAVREVNAELRRQFGGWGKPVAVGVMVLVAWAVIGWHELGHVVAGALARFRFHVYILGPLRVERDVGTGRIGARYNRELGTWGGMAGSFPQDARDLRRRVAMLLAGGPLASLLLAAAAVIALAAAADAMSPLARGVVAIAGLISAGIGLVTLLPMRGTDGGRLLRLKRGGPPAEREAAVFGIVGLLTSGVRARDWPPALADAAVGAPDGSTEDAYATLLAFMHAAGVRDRPRAERLLARVAELRDVLPPALRPTIQLEEAFIEAHYRRNAARARELLAALPAGPGPSVGASSRARVEAAIAFAEGDASSGRAHMRRAIAAATTRPGRQELEDLLGEMETSSNSTSRR